MARPRLNLLMILPPLVFLLFAAAAYLALKRDNPEELPSALVGQPAPGLDRLVPLRDDPAPTAADLTAPGVKLVNFFASWCGPCRVEHPVLSALAAEGVTVIGINYKDDPAKARGFLAELGDPYARIGADDSGRTGLDWGIYGVPETFVVDGDGKVILRYPGPLDEVAVTTRLRPAIAAAKAD
jgi:cytochrome c biogenesis protein CcmG, thiol:disulfide interchange protein DsbE